MLEEITARRLPNDPMDRQVLLDRLLARARRKLAADVHNGLLSEEQADKLFRATVRRYMKRLDLPLPLSA